MNPMRAETLVVAGNRVSYRRGGTPGGPPLLMLHGLGGDHRGLTPIAEQLTSFDVIVPDVPGYGDSAPLSRPHSLANYAEAVEVLRTELGLGPVHLLGHSLGASIALLHASTYPAALRSLTLLNPVSTATNLTATLGKLYYRIAAALPARAARFWLASRPAVYIADAMIIMTKDKAVRRRILDEDYENYARASVPAMIESFLSYYETGFEDRAARITVDTLLVTGDKDGIAPPASVTALGAAVPSSTVRILPGGGHLDPMERPDQLAALVGEFLSTQVSGSAGADGDVAQPTESV